MGRHKFTITMTIVIGCIATFQVLMSARRFDPYEKKAIEIGRDFLDGNGFKTGKILSIKLEEVEPNFYWNYALKFEKPDIYGLRSCWVIRFEQAKRPGHFFEVWVDASEYLVIGGDQCR